MKTMSAMGFYSPIISHIALQMNFKFTVKIFGISTDQNICNKYDISKINL